MSIKKRWVLAGVATCLVVAAGCSSSKGASSGSGGTTPGSTSATKTPYKIGLIGDETGVAAEIANPTLAGIQSYIKMVDSNGGINGHQIQLASAVDSQSTAAGAQTAFPQVLQGNPLAVIGSIDSLGIAAVPPLAGPAGVPVIIGSAPDSLLTPTPPSWLYVMVMPGAAQLDVSLGYLQQTLGSLTGKRIALVAAASSFGDGYTKEFQASASKDGYTIANVDRTPLQMTSFAPDAARIVSSNPDALVLLDVPAQTPLIVKDLAAAGYKGPVVGYDSTCEPAILDAIKSSQFVCMRGAPVPATTGPLATAAANAGVSSQLDSNFFSYGWDEAAVLGQALSSCGDSCTRSGLISSLQSVSNYTPPDNATFGPVSFSTTKHWGAQSAQFYSWNSTSSQVEPVGSPIQAPQSS
jgi:ABC-type branched-subunit amino acid transport system substrate-binding protein